MSLIARIRTLLLSLLISCGAIIIVAMVVVVVANSIIILVHETLEDARHGRRESGTDLIHAIVLSVRHEHVAGTLTGCAVEFHHLRTRHGNRWGPRVTMVREMIQRVVLPASMVGRKVHGLHVGIDNLIREPSKLQRHDILEVLVDFGVVVVVVGLRKLLHHGSHQGSYPFQVVPILQRFDIVHEMIGCHNNVFDVKEPVHVVKNLQQYVLLNLVRRHVRQGQSQQHHVEPLNGSAVG
mmetsp:Transcript_4931/g.11032  ORF Transcript_4931/g.11032 Transcript_4931/m.11032 type:complete len:238 (+) Transcript_4931:309-1022(+)